MSDFLGKLSSYNLFNYLLSGVLFVVLSEAFTSYSFAREDLVIGVFLYYFIGLVVSRIGSLLVEPLLKWVKFIRFAEYSDFVKISKIDPKLEILSEQNNIYRTLIAVFVGVLLLKFLEILKVYFFCVDRGEWIILYVFISLLLLFGYRKQTNYITRRIESGLKES